jgi:hypothetical protein
MGLRPPMLASTALTAVLAPLLLTATACGTAKRACAGQCSSPFQLQVTFRPGTTEQAALAAMNKCRANPLVVRIGQPHPIWSATSGQWAAVIYTKSMPIGARHIPLLTCLHHSPAVLTAGWPD